MQASELLKKVQQVEIATRGLSDRIFAGEYKSAFKGRGMAFSENREYKAGDEVRTIDWNVTARTGSPHVKVFEEERELTVFLLVDMSGSIQGGTQQRTKQDLVTELSAILAFSAMGNNDKVGAVLFTDRVEKFIPPGKGRTHALRIVREILDCTPQGKGSDLVKALGHFSTAMRKRTIAFLLSDFKDLESGDDLETSLKRTGRRHDLVAIQLDDPLNRNLPAMGWMKLIHPETGKSSWMNTSSRRAQRAWSAQGDSHRSQVATVMARAGVDHTCISTDETLVPPLMKLFHGRA